MYHVYEGLTLLFTIAGAVMADMWLGLYRSILIMSLVYMCGLLIITLGLIDPLNLPFEYGSKISLFLIKIHSFLNFRIFIIAGLAITIIGCGCIKANTNVFGGNQHKLPEQERQLRIFFSSQYFALKCGSTLARFSFPMLKEDVQCFGNDDCYALTFGIASCSICVAVLVFLSGSSHYFHVPSHGNMILKVFNCIKVRFWI